MKSLVRSGADDILDAAAGERASVCFANPGTTELPLVQSLETTTDIRSVLCLFEGVCTGAADGFARVADAPALTLLHLGPGLANGLANLHNARRAGSAVVNLVGDHPRDHLVHDSALTSDITGMASTVSSWVRATTTTTAKNDTVEAVRTAAAGNVTTLIVPVDVQAGAAQPNTRAEAPHAVSSTPVGIDVDAIEEAARVLRSPGAVLYLGGRALHRDGLLLAHRVQVATGCTVYTQTFAARLERGRGIPAFPPLPYFPEMAAKALHGIPAIVCVGTGEPVGIFAVPGVPGVLAPAGARRLEFEHADPTATLESLAETLRAPTAPALAPSTTPAYDGSAQVAAPSLGSILAEHVPDGAIVCEEAATNGYGYVRAAAAAAPHISLGLTGGAIGIGLPLALGAAVAAPGARVVALQADGSAMYTNQALWTMAREGLDITIVLVSNRRYAILQTELQRAGVTELGPVAQSLTSLDDPAIDWTALSRATGVPSVSCRTNDELGAALSASMREPGPMLLQVDVA